MVRREPPTARQDDLLSGPLEGARARGFVGRLDERASFDDLLARPDGARVLFVHGPGGIGKTTLLDALARRARAVGRSLQYLDARDVTPSETGVRAALAEGAGGSDAEVLLLDGYELLAPVDRWLWEDLLPSRPTGSVTVVAGRAPPSPARRLDPGWSRLVRVHELSALDATESDALLAGLGIEAALRPHLARIGRGHPLVLAMLAEAAREGRTAEALTDDPDIVSTLCAMLVDDVPDAAHRTGLATCAHATRTTQDLLHRVLGERAPEVWTWLGSRPYVRRGAIGLFLHDVVRELFESEFAHRSPDAYVALHRAVRGYFLQRLADPTEPHPDRAAAEILLLHRRGPLSEEAARLREGGLPVVSRAAPEDLDGIVRLIESWEGPTSARLARRWATEQPEGVYRVRSDAGVEAFSMQCYLPTGGALDEDDPVAAAVLRAVEQEGPLRPGERVNVNRYAGASEVYQRDPLVLFVNGVSCLLEWSHHNAAWTFIVAIDDPHYGPYFEYLGMRRMVEVDVAGLDVVAYGWDRRRFPPEMLFELMARRELSGESGPPPAEWVRPAPLSRNDFALAVRAALGTLGSPDRLSASPLLASALVEPGAPQPGARLRDVVLAAIETIGTEPRGDEHRRLLERTYLKGAPSQEAAAQVLDLPFSTYRRHLAQAQDRLVEVLWSVEIGDLRLPPPGAEGRD
ncbi:putative AAA ATPase [Nostocoides japonicum T1-X7]|uniref:Putative AAA ATPase n=1 Tax=Nostocoides japonicum T1-X7 TaxID=1194083 RepID=A0A077LYA5_9MICO|nr:ATP-binding protein [Tetrasphaera japonica]CCH76930.1 putative AAA ATPase [Tetrasphaera japonica T1-X7]